MSFEKISQTGSVTPLSNFFVVQNFNDKIVQFNENDTSRENCSDFFLLSVTDWASPRTEKETKKHEKFTGIFFKGTIKR